MSTPSTSTTTLTTTVITSSVASNTTTTTSSSASGGRVGLAPFEMEGMSSKRGPCCSSKGKGFSCSKHDTRNPILKYFSVASSSENEEEPSERLPLLVKEKEKRQDKGKGKGKKSGTFNSRVELGYDDNSYNKCPAQTNLICKNFWIKMFNIIHKASRL
jgi:hypothetical protein